MKVGTNQDEKPMSLPRAARYLGIGRNAIYEFVRDGRIETITWPNRVQVRVTREALDKFRRSCTGTIAGTNEGSGIQQPKEITGHFQASPRLTKSREAQLDEVFARK